MTTLRKTLFVATAMLAAAFTAPAMATPVVGQAVTGIGGSDIYTGSSDWIGFYIPLTDENWDLQTMERDRCKRNRGQCVGGTLSFYVHFDVDWTGGTELAIDFYDFDADGFADTNYLLEVLGLVVLAADGSTILALDHTAVLSLLTGNTAYQHLNLNFDIDGDFYVHFEFGAEFDFSQTSRHYKKFYNSPEWLRARAGAVTVPEPGTLALLGFGLLLTAYSRRRATDRRKSG